MITFCRCIIIFALLGLFGCSKDIDRSMLIGKYIANHKNGIETLELKSDGTYVYYYKISEGKELLNTNRWQFEYQNNEPRITFVKFIFGLPGYGTKVPGFWDVEVIKTGKTLRLNVDQDMNYYLEKQLQ